MMMSPILPDTIMDGHGMYVNLRGHDARYYVISSINLNTPVPAKLTSSIGNPLSTLLSSITPENGGIMYLRRLKDGSGAYVNIVG
jgi:hypothetical protein